MSVEEREQVVASLPGEVTWDEMAMPEGDRHFLAKLGALDVLRSHFNRHRRLKVYLGAELPVYYPGERRFAPDLLAVRDVERHERDKWVVSAEGKGLDWVMEVHVGGDRKKDAEYNVRRYARLGIPEYFIYDRKKERLVAYRLPEPGRGSTAAFPWCGDATARSSWGWIAGRGGRLRFWSGARRSGVGRAHDRSGGARGRRGAAPGGGGATAREVANRAEAAQDTWGVSPTAPRSDVSLHGLDDAGAAATAAGGLGGGGDGAIGVEAEGGERSRRARRR